MSTTVVINEVPKFNLSVQQGDGPAVTLSQPDAPALTLSMSGPQGPTGPQGATGPNEITTSTSTTLDGYIYGDGTNIAGATLAASTPDVSTLVLRDSLGEAEFQGLRVNPSGSLDGNFDVGGGVFTVDMQTLNVASSATFSGAHIQDLGTGDSPQFTDLTITGTLTADHIADLHLLFVQNTAPTVVAGTPYVWFNTSGGNLQVLYDDGL